MASMRTTVIAALFSLTFRVVAQTPEEISKKVADAIAMRPGADRTDRFKKLASECDQHPLQGDPCADAYDWYAALLRVNNKLDPQVVTLTAKALTVRENGPHTDSSLALSVELAGMALFDTGERINSKELFDRAFELHKSAVSSIGAEPQIPNSNEAIDLINPQVRRDPSSPPTSTNPSGQPGTTGRIANTSMPSVVYKTDPAYSDMARVFKISGSVMLRIVISKTGVTESIQLMQGVGFGLDEQAARTVRAWRFRPGTKAGEPVSAQSQIENNFRLL